MNLIAVIRSAWRLWKRLGRFMGDVVGRVILTIFHFTLLVPFAAVLKLTSDPLQLRIPTSSSYWIAREATKRTLEESRRLA